MIPPNLEREPRLEYIRIERLIPSPENCRKPGNAQDIVELTASIAAVGVLEPLIVRPQASPANTFEVIAGCRRLAAARGTEFTDVPCLVVEPCSDALARQISAAENLHRRELTPLQESMTSFALFSEGGTAQSAAAILGRSPERIARSAKLMCLLPDWKAVLRTSGSGWGCIPVGVWEHLARLPMTTQLELYQTAEAATGAGATPPEFMSSVPAFDRYVASRLHQLARMSWDVEDPKLLPEAGNCGDCVKKSGVENLLWEDDELLNRAGKPEPQCLDPACFREKLIRYAGGLIEAIRDGGDFLVVVETGELADVLTERFDLAPGSLYYPEGVGFLAHDDPSALPAVYVTETEASRTWAHDLAKPVPKAEPKPRRKSTAEERRENLARRRSRVFVQTVHRQLDDLAKLAGGAGTPDHIRSKVGSTCQTPYALLRIALAFGIEDPLAGEPSITAARWEAWGRLCPSEAKTVEGTLAELGPLSALLLPLIAGKLSTALARPSPGEVEAYDAEAVRVCELLGWDHPGIRTRVENDLPEPKTWAKSPPPETPEEDVGDPEPVAEPSGS